MADMISCGVYTTNSSEACIYVATHSEAKIIVIDTYKQFLKYIKDKGLINGVEYFIFTGEIPPDVKQSNVYSWDDIMTMGRLTYQKHKAELNKRIDKQSPGTICSYVYTSGTTSLPKACMLTHDSIISSPFTLTDAYYNVAKTTTTRERVVSFLPLSHVAAFAMDVILHLLGETILYFAQPDALQGSLLQTLVEVRPTLFLAVPRVYEKVQQSVLTAISKKGFPLQGISEWALKVGHEATTNQLQGQQNPFGFSLANMLVLGSIKKKLGLDQCQLFMIGGAVTQKSTVDFFASLNIKLINLYGLSEACGPLTYSLPQATKLYSCGKAGYGLQIKIDNPNEDGEGEICFRGRGIFVGYLKDEKNSKEAFDNEGYFHSGDLGYTDPDGFLYVTGRLKDLIKTSGGENIPPLLIENAFQNLCPLCSSFVVVGDKRNYLTALITIKSELSKKKLKPTQNVHSDCIEILNQIGSQARTLEEASKCPKVIKYVEQCIEKLNKGAISKAQEIKKFAILPREFSVEEDEITPTMKLKRYKIYKKYAGVINELYKNTKL